MINICIVGSDWADGCHTWEHPLSVPRNQGTHHVTRQAITPARYVERSTVEHGGLWEKEWFTNWEEHFGWLIFTSTSSER